MHVTSILIIYRFTFFYKQKNVYLDFTFFSLKTYHHLPFPQFKQAKK